MTEPEFKDLLARYEKGECSPEERELLEKWLNSPGKGQKPFINDSERTHVRSVLRESVFRNAGLTTKTGDGSFSDDRTATLSTGRLRVRRLTTAYRIAASILFAAMIGYGVFRYDESITAEKYASTEVISGTAIQKVHLSDGSIVWLKPHSSLNYPKHFSSTGERRVSLQGEALFEVERIPTQPFIVEAGALTATVLGTSFNIKTTKEQTEVVVLTGKVSVTSATDKKGLVLSADGKAIYNESDKYLAKVEAPVAKTVAEAIVAGTQYDMNFNGTSMRDVIRRIEGKFNVSVTMSDPRLRNCVITADFTDQPLLKTMDIIAKTLAVQYKIESGEVRLTGKGCN